MFYNKFRFLFLLIFLPFDSFSFESKQCLDLKFEVDIEKEGLFFGMIPYRFKIIKDRCEVKIQYQEYTPVSWEVDLCREPVHLKKTDWFGLKILKKEKNCKGVTSPFCDQWSLMMGTLRDEALILAKGERDSLETDHGKIYCLFHLLQAYGDYDYIFSFHKDVDIDIFSLSKDKLLEKCDLPEKEEKASQLELEQVETSTGIEPEAVPQDEDKVIF